MGFFRRESPLAAMPHRSVASGAADVSVHANVLGPLAGPWLRPRGWCWECRGRPVAMAPLARITSNRRADRVVCVSRSVAAIVRRSRGWHREAGRHPQRSGRVRVCRHAGRGPEAARRGRKPQGAAVRRPPAPAKGPRLALGDSAEFFDQLPDHDLVLVGEGPQRAACSGSRGPEISTSACTSSAVETIWWLCCRLATFSCCRRDGRECRTSCSSHGGGTTRRRIRVEGVAELLGDEGAHSQTIEPGDAAGFITRVVSFAQDPALANRMGTANRRRAAANFTLAAMVARYESLYEYFVRATRWRKKSAVLIPRQPIVRSHFYEWAYGEAMKKNSDFPERKHC